MLTRRLIPVLTALVVGGAVAGLHLIGFRPMEIIELRGLDTRLKQRGAMAHTDEVVVVAVDDDSLFELGRWPWSRSRVGELLERVNAGGARVIGVDLVQSEPTAACELGGVADSLAPACRDELTRALGSGQGEDARLAASVRAAGRIVLGYFFSRDGDESPYSKESAYGLVQRAPGADESALPRGHHVTQNLPALASAAAGLGYFNFGPDMDGLFRHASLALRFHDRIVLPLALAMLQRAWPERQPALRLGPDGVEQIRVGDIEIPVDRHGKLLINYRGAGRTFRHISAADVLAGRVAPAEFHDKLVVVGVSARGVGDIRAAPFDAEYPGVEIHATVLDNILRRDFIRTPGWSGPDVVAILALCLQLGVLLQWTRGWSSAGLAAAVIAVYLVVTQWLFIHTGIALTAFYPALAAGLTYVAIGVHHYVAVDREHRRTRRTLEVYLSPALAAFVSERPEMLKLGGEKSDRSVLFSDVQGFTNISERLAPEQLVELLNAYLGEMTDAVFAQDGMLDKYIGDGVMAVWGAPVPQADHAARACRSALAMTERLVILNARNAARGWPTLRVRIGLNSGPMVFGNMGSPGHLSLTVMGDNVNLGARLEGINKLYGSAIIASEATVRAAGDAVVVRELDQVRVRGRSGTVRIFEILGSGGTEAKWQAMIAHFHSGLAAYRARDWDAARIAFEAAMAARMNDGPSDLYLRRLRQFSATPPPDNWEAVTTFEGS
ncbi:MAG: adenylate/guanylate cyclase domain-containing protein [bacterium]